MRELRCANSMDFGILIRRGLLEEHTHPGVERECQSSKEQYQKTDSRKLRNHQLACDVRETDIVIWPHRGRFQHFESLRFHIIQKKHM